MSHVTWCIFNQIDKARQNLKKYSEQAGFNVYFAHLTAIYRRDDQTLRKGVLENASDFQKYFISVKIIVPVNFCQLTNGCAYLLGML